MAEQGTTRSEADTAHEPLPWKVGQEPDCIYTERGRLVAQVTTIPRIGPESGRATAEFIVRACNAHDDLLAAAKFTLSVLQNSILTETSERMAVAKLVAAIRKAGEGAPAYA